CAPPLPPPPRRLPSPPTRILMGVEKREQTPAQTPWWLTLIRIVAAGLVILALAEPVLNANRERALSGSGPVIIAVDNTWAAAAHWSERTRVLERLLAEAEAQSRPGIIAPTAATSKSPPLKVEPPAP